MSKITINYCNQDLIVTFEYDIDYRGVRFIEIEKIFLGPYDITELLEAQMSEIAEITMITDYGQRHQTF